MDNLYLLCSSKYGLSNGRIRWYYINLIHTNNLFILLGKSNLPPRSWDGVPDKLLQYPKLFISSSY